MRDTKYEAEYWNEQGGERWVANIDELEHMLAPLSTHLLEHAAPAAGEHVLDVGCGGGVTSAACAARTGAEGSVVGLDISEIILAVARQRYAGTPGLSFLTADAATHPFLPRAYDLVTSRFGVMFFPERIAAFRNIRTGLKPGGRLVFMCWQSIKVNPWMGVAANAAFSVLPRPEKPAPDAPGPFSLAEPEAIEAVLGEAGYRDLQMAPVEEPLALGDLDAAVGFLTRFGPAVDPLNAADENDRAAAIAAIRSALAPFVTPRGVLMNGAAWIVRASPE